MKFWVPLAKLSYVVYLIFPIIDATVISSMSQALFLSYNTMFYLLAFNFAFCMVAGFFCHILIEGPLMNLIFSRQIYSIEATKLLQRNFRKLDETVRQTKSRSHQGSMSRSPSTMDENRPNGLLKVPLSKDYFTNSEGDNTSQRIDSPLTLTSNK